MVIILRLQRYSIKNDSKAPVVLMHELYTLLLIRPQMNNRLVGFLMIMFKAVVCVLKLLGVTIYDVTIFMNRKKTYEFQ